MKPTNAVRASSLLVMVLGSGVGAEDTVHPFRALFQPPLRIISRDGTEPGAQRLEQGGWDGPYLRLTSEVTSQLNQLRYRRVSDPASRVALDFQMRLSPGQSGGADGIGVAFANTDLFGAEPNGAAPAIFEEPNLAGSLGLGFDTFDNGIAMDGGESTVSLHFNGALFASVGLDLTQLVSLETGRVLFVSTRIEAEAGGSNVTVQIRDENGTVVRPFDGFFVPGLEPYPFRLVFGGRTGGATSNQDIDNVRLEAEGAQIFHDTFDADFAPRTPALLPGGTPFALTGFGSAPGPLVRTDEVIDGPGPLESDGYVRLVTEAVGQTGLLAFDQTSQDASEIRARFLLRGLDGGDTTRADGASFLLFDPTIHGATGLPPVPISNWEEPNLVRTFGIGFDTWSNTDITFDEGVGGVGEDNHVSVHWDGQRVAAVGLAKEDLDLVNGAWNRVTVHVVEAVDGAGSYASVAIEDGTDGSVHPIVQDVFIPGMSFPSGARVAFAARTGGAADNYDVDDVLVRFGPDPPRGVGPFTRGECNEDGSVDLSDAVCILGWLFLGGPVPGCLAAVDTNADQQPDLSDAVYLLAFLFLGGPPPLAPFPGCGTSDLSSDIALGCDPQQSCAP